MSKEKTNILEKIINILQDYVDDNTVITKDSYLVEDIGLSSLDAMQLSVILSDEFGIKIKNKDLANFETVNDIVKFLESLNG